MQYEYIRVRNYKQACYYVSNDVKPVDIEYKCGRMTFIFKTEDTSDVWQKWRNNRVNFANP